jgi:flavin reductase (DIM6/NTAB) family NADH-FMN oxidoreductase RutF
VLVCVDHRSEANAGMRETGLFAVSVLAEDQAEISRRFAARGPAKLEGFPFVEGRQGLPLVPGALAHVECRVRSFHDEGDHAVWVGEVRSLSARPGRPLLHHAGAYGRLAGGPRSGKAGGDRV